MTPYYQHGGVVLYHGDCREVLQSIEPNSIAAIVTDPPYGLEFMGVAWDTFSNRSKVRPRVRNEWGDFGSREHARHPSEVGRIQRKKGLALQQFSYSWAVEALKVLLPGAHLLAFGGTRTYHRMTCAIEDAGFEIRDCLQWLYGSGFPKSLDVSKAIDAAVGATRETKQWRQAEAGGIGMGLNVQCPDCGKWMRSPDPCRCPRDNGAQTDAAKQWSGWGTALKPANEPIVLARKPLIGTVVATVLAHGTGAINVDGCRIDGAYQTRDRDTEGGASIFGTGRGGGAFLPTSGRWPANVLHDGSDEVLALFPESEARPAKAIIAGGTSGSGVKGQSAVYGSGRLYEACTGYADDLTSAARFFYTAKASRAERGTGNTHPTVKPLDLMRWLVTLITPPDGLVLDPFAGSGTILLAARMLGRQAIGIEQDEAHCEIAVKRIEEAALLPFEAAGNGDGAVA